MPATYVLVDLENVQPEDLEPLRGSAYQLRVFVGSRQSTLPRKFAIALHQDADAADYIEINGHGKNALDFHIAYYLGKFAVEDPGSSFYVISEDKGFDALITHLNQSGVSCSRHENFDTLAVKSPTAATTSKATRTPAPRPDAAAPPSFDERLRASIKLLTGMKSAPPRSLKTLRSTLASKLPNGCPEPEVKRLIDALTRQGFVCAEKPRLTYEFDIATPAT